MDLVKYLVQRQIFCPITGNVLDVRTCLVFEDEEGDPAAVYAPEVRAGLTPEILEKLSKKGLTLRN